jgi:hypothetical protein
MPKTEEELKEFIRKYVVKEEKGFIKKKLQWTVYGRGERVRLFKLLVRWYLLIKARELYEKKYKDKGRWEDLMTAIMIKICLETNIRKELSLPEPLTNKEKQEENIALAVAIVSAQIERIAQKDSDKGPYGIITPDGYRIKLARSFTAAATNYDFFKGIALVPGTKDVIPLGNTLSKKGKKYLVSPEKYVKIKLND